MTENAIPEHQKEWYTDIFFLFPSLRFYFTKLLSLKRIIYDHIFYLNESVYVVPTHIIPTH